MIAFQHIKSGRFVRSLSAPHFNAAPELVPLLADAYPWHQCDEERLRKQHAALAQYRTVTFSTRIDHPLNNLAALTREELAERYPIAKGGAS